MQLYHTFPARLWKHWRRPFVLPTHLPRFLLNPSGQPRFVRGCQVTQHFCHLLRYLDWCQLPRSLRMHRQGEREVPLPAYVGAYLLKLEQQMPTFGHLHRFLCTHPALVWALGFPLVYDSRGRLDIEACLPSQQHFSRKLTRLPNQVLQSLLDSQVAWFQHQLGNQFGDVVSIDTKHILAWVKENNPKAFIKEGRFDKNQQPAGDLDCKLGCKRRRNQMTPTKEGQPTSEKVSIGEYYWGYASGVAATKVPSVGEFVLAELTQTFDYGDLTYFLPLMAQVEQRLGRRPRFGTADAAFDAFYVYDYFHADDHDGFAAVPLRNPKQQRFFDEAGLPLCAAGLAMPLMGTFVNRTSLVQHRRGRYRCPLLHPEPNGDTCPSNHKKWADGGCKLVMPTVVGARIRHQLDRDGDCFKQIYNQRTAVERIFSQAVALGIERPKLRNRTAITNINTLTYLLINLRTMHRIADDIS
ncbi:MAG: transposase [Ardenticatenaceae bacterium]|nr:transposase [Ardenticatenaceae bacterium]